MVGNRVRAWVTTTAAAARRAFTLMRTATCRPAAVSMLFCLCLLAFSSGSVIAAEAHAPTLDSRIRIVDGFVDERACSSCHADQSAAFVKSHHAKAMAVADEKTVRGNFNNVQFDHDGVVTTFSSRDGRFFVRTEGAGRQRDGVRGQIHLCL